MKKLIAVLIAALLLTALLAYPALADTDEAAAPTAYFRSVTGTVTSIDAYAGIDGEPVDGWLFVGILDENGGPAVILITDETVFAFEAEPKVGDTVTAWFPANMPMILIYPPRYTAHVLSLGAPDDVTVTVDRFSEWGDGPDGYLVSDDGTLAIHIGEDSAVITPDGNAFDDVLDGRNLVVIYDVSTRSIPAQTTPITVIVLPVEEEMVYTHDVADMQIYVDGDAIASPSAFQDDDGVVMVPLRAIAEALGFTVTWHGDTRTVSLDERVVITLDTAVCVVDGESVELASAPVLKGGYTYVPLRFFKDAAGMNNAYVFEGQIVVDRDGEIME